MLLSEFIFLYVYGKFCIPYIVIFFGDLSATLESLWALASRLFSIFYQLVIELWNWIKFVSSIIFVMWLQHYFPSFLRNFYKCPTARISIFVFNGYVAYPHIVRSYASSVPSSNYSWHSHTGYIVFYFISFYLFFRLNIDF